MCEECLDRPESFTWREEAGEVQHIKLEEPKAKTGKAHGFLYCKREMAQMRLIVSKQGSEKKVCAGRTWSSMACRSLFRISPLNQS